MPQVASGWIVLPILAVVAVGAFIWKKKRYVKVGCINRILFYPVKSLRGLEITEGKCTKLGLEVNGLLDRSFMIISEEDNKLISQREAPTLSLLTPKIVDSNLIISGPNVDPLTVKIESTPNKDDKIIECQVHGEVCYVVDCGEQASKWFQNFLKRPNIRLVHFFPDFPKRKFVQNHQFFKKLREKHPISLQDIATFHVMSQSSIDDLNSRLVEKQISFRNFRPNILVDGCAAPFAEDSWQYIKFGEEVEMENVFPITRCLMTTVDPDKGILTQKEPLTTLRKYRIPKDPKIIKILGSIPCFGTGCFVLKTGTIKVQDEIYATITRPLDTVQK
ncbi:mitochondrial amidoxime-reducing component 1 [Parasteatoda tepidariorum]|uniref:mitochondrial amidoxime-reducing component 1 n=1 Tax=Parasteatoda tepidariorum TaxID=114398 RepID=UPI00077F9B42|nr:mitochondrial amidoxime-reducing component 1 [Parasteatoda tepidariorum]XP_015929060.1 mitochondrial amidoxime-reducing component 1 [Parasteatoda tepidariorum]XP_015929061.1 mitochondrial amidoxime-reducing component 1 [Parasteatoda tepidariorum]XP_015929062.1 mitochondrial amidoxime-reducing component 1 [Parasteatoda tepidariorum]